MTSRAAFHTSASTQPPPTVPINEPSSRTRILALSKLGMEPFTCTMVATAHFWPSFRKRTISSYRSIWIDYIVDPPGSMWRGIILQWCNHSGPPQPSYRRVRIVYWQSERGKLVNAVNPESPFVRHHHLLRSEFTRAGR